MPRKNPKQLIAKAREEGHETAIAKAKLETTLWKARHKDALNAALNAEHKVDVLLGLLDTPPAHTLGRQPGSTPRGVAAIVPASDWHTEEEVRPEAVSGKNHFDLKEAERRICRFYSKTLELIEWQNHFAKVVEIWHPLLGDLITGYIHEELMETNNLSPTETCIFLQDMLSGGIDLWRKETKLPIFIPTCVGNHGRTTQKIRIKTSHRNSFEWLLYKTLERTYRKNSNVMWNVGEGYHNTQKIMGRKVRFHHGDGMRYFGGVGGITIPINKAIAQWDKVEDVDFDIFGHWHTFLEHYPKWVSCGSLIGYNEFAVRIKAEFQHPTQTFIIIDKRYGITLPIPIFLTKPTRR